MDTFFDRLENLLRSFFNEDGDQLFGTRQTRRPFNDPDFESAYDELEDFLNAGKHQQKRTFSWSKPQQTVPESLRKDFEELGVPFGASEEDCKAAYKRLLKIHHPDRHAGHPGNMKKATEKMTRINAAYQRIDAWRQTGRVE